jgi:hypothetical protein
MLFNHARNLAERDVSGVNRERDIVNVSRTYQTFFDLIDIKCKENIKLDEELNDLRPFKEELLKIAEKFGDPDDPFAVWEVLEKKAH